MWKLIKSLVSYYTLWDLGGGGGAGGSVTDAIIIFNGPKRYTIKFTNVSDGTDESGTLKLDISTLTGLNGLAPSFVKVKEIGWSIQGFTSVRLHWDHDTDDEIAVLGPGNGLIDYTASGNAKDPRSAGGTGDILFTTAGATSGDTYEITLVLQLKD